MKKKPLRIGLFWKILVVFWLVFAIILTFNLFFTQLNSENIRYRQLPPHLHHQLENTRKKLRFMLKRHPNLRETQPKFTNHIFLLDENGKDYFGKKTSEMIIQLHKRVDQSGNLMTAFRKQRLYFGGLPIDLRKKSYQIYLTERFSILSRGYFGVFIREFAHNLLFTTFVVSFPLSFILAWFFTRPIKKLQKAIKEMSGNLTERKNLNKLIDRRDEFGELARDFDSMANHLDAIMTSKTRLLSDVSHELRSPLARIQIALGLARKKQFESESPELERIKLEADRMNQMISGLLDYSKMNTQYTFQDKTRFNLSELLEILITDANFESQQHSIQIKSCLQENVEFNGIKTILVSCFENILRNAIRYASNEIKVECKVDTQNNQICITISDDGDGVADEQLDRIFEAFYRPEDDRSRQSGGVGLGLSIAKKAIQTHKGTIYAQNTTPHGLSISIQLPLSV